jgi:hypothetical protein
MKTTFASLVIAVTLFHAPGVATASVDRWETLRAINWVENPNNHARPGKHGELGPYQFRSATWSMHTKRPFSDAVNRSASDEVAVRHYDWIKRSLERLGVEATPFNIAMAWNCGVTAVASGRAPNASFDYAVRVTNLVSVIKEGAESRAAEQASVSAPLTPSEVHRFTLRLEELEAMPVSGDYEVRFRVFSTETPRFVLASD